MISASWLLLIGLLSICSSHRSLMMPSVDCVISSVCLMIKSLCDHSVSLLLGVEKSKVSELLILWWEWAWYRYAVLNVSVGSVRWISMGTDMPALAGVSKRFIALNPRLHSVLFIYTTAPSPIYHFNLTPGVGRVLATIPPSTQIPRQRWRNLIWREDCGHFSLSWEFYVELWCLHARCTDMYFVTFHFSWSTSRRNAWSTLYVTKSLPTSAAFWSSYSKIN